MSALDAAIVAIRTALRTGRSADAAVLVLAAMPAAVLAGEIVDLLRGELQAERSRVAARDCEMADREAWAQERAVLVECARSLEDERDGLRRELARVRRERGAEACAGVRR